MTPTRPAGTGGCVGRARELRPGGDPTAATRRARNAAHRPKLTDPVLWRLAALVHEADLDDARFYAPEPPGFDLALRALSMVESDQRVLELTRPLFDGTYEFFRRELLLGREPA